MLYAHCGACPAPCGGGTVTRSMGRVANATLLRFDRYDEPPDSRTAETSDPSTDNWPRTLPRTMWWWGSHPIDHGVAHPTRYRVLAPVPRREPRGGNDTVLYLD